jgi:DNA processing protein
MSRISFSDAVKIVQMHSVQGPGVSMLHEKLSNNIDDAYDFALSVNWEKGMFNRIRATHIVNFAQQKHISIIPYFDERYPAVLKNIPDPPAVVYCKGEYLPKDSFSMAVVGTRKASKYGRKVLESLIPALVTRGITIVSGMALGIDSLAHTIALNNKGRTIAVLGSGVDQAYPRQNLDLYNRIPTAGCLISEFPIGRNPERYTFPQRNRIISGLTHGTIVIEADEKSGSLITARSATEQGREVFSIPGDIFNPTSQGTNKLIKMGAKLVTNIEDILEEVQAFRKYTEVVATAGKSGFDVAGLKFSKSEMQIYRLLEKGNLGLDDMVGKTDMATGEILSVLTKLELRGVVKNLGGDEYMIV